MEADFDQAPKIINMIEEDFKNTNNSKEPIDSIKKEENENQF